MMPNPLGFGRVGSVIYLRSVPVASAGRREGPKGRLKSAAKRGLFGAARKKWRADPWGM
jgi:hypothetical protein